MPETLEGIALAQVATHIADSIQAEDIVILDLRGLSQIADYFVICHGSSLPHLKAIRRDVADKLREDHGLKPHSQDGDPESRWLVLDYVDVIVHIFHADTRDHYALEELWSDAPRVAVELSTSPPE